MLSLWLDHVLMSETRTVPLVHYVDGVRYVIGEAVVETDGDYLLVAAKVDDAAYRSLFPKENISSLSLGNGEVTTIPKERRVKSKKGKKNRSS